MKRFILATALIGFALPGFAQDRAQLIATAGLTATEATSMTLTEIAAVKFNKDSARDDAQTVFATHAPVMIDPVRDAQLIAAANLTPAQARHLTLNQLAAGKFNAEASRDEIQVMVSTRRSIQPLPLQLIAAAGLSPAEARGMSLTDLHVAKINRESGRDDQQPRF